MVKTTGFRVASILIPSVLLAILIGVIFIVLRDNPTTVLPAATRTPLTAQATPPATSFLTTQNQPAALTAQLRYEDAGIAFRPPEGYLLDLNGQGATLTAQPDSRAAGTILVMRNESPQAYRDDADDLAQLFDTFVRFYAEQDGFAVGASADVQLGDRPGLAVDLLGDDLGADTTDGFAGRIALAGPVNGESDAEERLFVLIGVGPAGVWRSQGLADYMAVLDSIEFLPWPPDDAAMAAAEPAFTPTDTAPEPATEIPTETPAPITPMPTDTPDATPTPEPVSNGTVLEIPAADTPVPQAAPLTLDVAQWTLYTNGNFINRLALRGGTLWAATTGGAVAWDVASSNHAKFTTADATGATDVTDGPTTNHLIGVADCDLPGFGVVFIGDRSLQVYAPEEAQWRTLSAQTGELADDEVVDLYCDAAAGYLVLLYARAGVDIYNAATGVWNHLALDAAIPDAGPPEAGTLEAGTLEADVGLLRHVTGVNSANALWIAAQQGLLLLQGNLFDLPDVDAGEDAVPAEDEDVPEGISLQVFTTDNSPLLNHQVTALAPAGENAVWLATNGALYRTDGESWESYTTDTIQGDSFPQGRINGLVVDGQAMLWVASDQTNICRFDPAQQACVAFYVNQEGMVDGPLTSLALDDQGRLFYGTMGNGVSQFDGESWQALLIEDELSPGNTVRSFAVDSDGALWIAANAGAARIDPVTDATPIHYTPVNSPLPFADVAVIGPGAPQGVWFGAHGAAYFNSNDWATFSVENNLVDAPIQAITSDGIGRTWLGSQGAGISIWTGSSFFNLTSANGLPSEDITALASVDDVVWIGTRNGGLLRFQNNQLRFYTTRDEELPSNHITRLAIQTDGSVLIGTDRGLAHLVNDLIHVVPELSVGAVTALATGPDNRYWVVLDGATLYTFDGEAIFQVEPVSLWPPALITDLLVDPTGHLWMGFHQGGLAQYVPKIE